jgi:hypothetical protein
MGIGSGGSGGGGSSGGSGGSGVWPFMTGSTNFGQSVQSTSTSLWFTGSAGIMASSTSYLTSTNIYGYLSVGTSTPAWGRITIATSTAPQLMLGDGTAGSSLWALRSVGGNLYFATSTHTATSSNTAFWIDGTTGAASFGSSSGTGDADVTFGADANAWTMGYYSTDKSFRISSSTSIGTNTAFMISKSTLGVGIGTTTPALNSLLTIATSSGPQLTLSDGSPANPLWTLRAKNGNLYIATSTHTATSSASALTLTSDGNLIIDGSVTTCTIGNGSSATNCSSSDQRLKDSISTLTATSGLSAILELNPRSYVWNPWMVSKGAATSTQFGFIAQEVAEVFPHLVHLNAKGFYTLDYQGFFAPIVMAIQELNTELVYVAGATTTVSEITEGTASTTTPWAGSFSTASQWLKDGINGIADPLVRVWRNTMYAMTGIFEQVFAKEIYADNVTAQKVTAVQQMCIGSVCVDQAQLAALLAGAGAATASTTTTTASSTGTVAPIISVNGNNPASVAVGSTYSDLGASITGPADALNLGISAIVDGGATTTLDQIQIDTSASGTHTILYFAITQDGIQGSAVRTVVVYDQTATMSSTSTPPVEETSQEPVSEPAPDSIIDTMSASSTSATASSTSATSTTP